MNNIQNNNENNANFTGVWVPYEFLKLKLNFNEIFVLSIISALDNQNGCYATNEYIGKIINRSKSTTSDIINKLVTKGYVNSKLNNKSKNNTKRILKVKDTVSRKLRIQYPESQGYSIPKVKNQYNNDINNDNRESKGKLTHFDFIKNSYGDELKKLIDKYYIGEDQLELCINKFNKKNIKNVNVLDFKSFLLNWYNILKNKNQLPHQWNSRPEFKRIG
jgi:hypothetical protein